MKVITRIEAITHAIPLNPKNVNIQQIEKFSI